MSVSRTTLSRGISIGLRTDRPTGSLLALHDWGGREGAVEYNAKGVISGGPLRAAMRGIGLRRTYEGGREGHLLTCRKEVSFDLRKGHAT